MLYYSIIKEIKIVLREFYMRSRGFNVIISVCVLLFSMGCSDKKQEQEVVVNKAPKRSVEVYVVKKEKMPIWILFSGKTEAYKDVAVMARVKGNLEKRFFEPGDYVKKGQKLFKIEEDEYLAILDQHKASKRKNQAALKLAISSYERYKPLVEKELASREKLDQLIAEKEQVEALIKADDSTIRQAQLDLGYTVVEATTDGMIGRNLIDVGNMVGTSHENSKLAVIVKSNPLYVNFTPNGNDTAMINRYKSEPRPKVVVYIPPRKESGDDTYKGNIDFVANTTDESTGTVSMRAIIDNPKNILLPGTFVEIQLFLSDQIPVIALSPENVMENQLGSYVFVVDANNTIKTTQVKIEYATQGMLIIKNGTLKVGEKVIVSPLIKLRNGLKVITKESSNPVLKQVK